MIIPIEVHTHNSIINVEDMGSRLVEFEKKIFGARVRCVHQHFVEYSVKNRLMISECVLYHQELNRIERDCDFFRTGNFGSGSDFTKFSRFDEL